LDHPNQFIYTVINQTTVSIICKDKTQTCWINGAGLMSVPPMCILQSGDMEISSYNVRNTSQPKIYIPTLNVTDILEMVVKDKQTTTTIEPFTIDPDLLLIDEALKKQSDDSNNVYDEFSASWHDVHHYTITYILLAIGITALVWFLCRRKVNNKRTNNPTTNITLASIPIEPRPAQRTRLFQPRDTSLISEDQV